MDAKEREAMSAAIATSKAAIDWRSPRPQHNSSLWQVFWSEAVKWATAQERKRCVAVISNEMIDNDDESLSGSLYNNTLAEAIEAIQREATVSHLEPAAGREN